MLKLYHAALSPCAQKVRIALGEKGLDYVSKPIDILAKENLQPNYLKINPNGLIPALVHDGVAIIESSLINEYIDDVFVEVPLRPTEPARLASMRLWPKLVDEKLHPASGAVTWAVSLRQRFIAQGIDAAREAIGKVKDPQRRKRQLDILENGFEAESVRESVAIYESCFQKMEDALSRGPWLVGNCFSLADIAMAPYVQGIDQWGLNDVFIDNKPKLADWFKRMTARPAFQKEVISFIPEDWGQRMKANGAAARPKLIEMLQTA